MFFQVVEQVIEVLLIDIEGDANGLFDDLKS